MLLKKFSLALFLSVGWAFAQITPPPSGGGGGGGGVAIGNPVTGGTANYNLIIDGSSNVGQEQFLGAARFPALTGPVTTVAGSLATTIGAGQVTLGMQASLAANSVFCNNTGAPATPIACSIAQMQTLLGTNFTLVTPTIASFVNATHNHQNAAGGGQLNLTLAANATGTPSATTFLRGDNTWSAPAGGGSAGVYTSVTFSATPTFTAGSNTGDAWTITLTGNVTSSTLASAATGERLGFKICQDATGSRTFAWPTGFANAATISPVASACTKQEFVWDGTNAQPLAAATSDGGPTIFTSEQAAPGTPPASQAYCWLDSTNHIFSCKDNNAATVMNLVVPLTCTNQVHIALSAAGVFTCVTITSAYVDSTITKNNAVNTATAAMTLDMSASTAANAVKVPVVAGATATANGAIDYDSTNNMLHAAQTGADAFIPQFTVTPAANNNCVKWVVSGSNYKLGDQGAACGGGATTNIDYTKHWELTLVNRNGAGNIVTGYSTSIGNGAGAPWGVFSGTPTGLNKVTDSNFQFAIQMAPTAGGNMAGSNGAFGAKEWFRSNNTFLHVRVEPVTSTNARYTYGFSDCAIATIVAADNPTCNNAYMLASTTTAMQNWQCVVGNGTTSALTDTGVAWAAGTAYELNIALNAGNIVCTVGATATTVTTNLPAAASGMYGGYITVAATSGAATTTHRWDRLYLQADQ